MNLFPEDMGATFSICRRYRYLLWRRWGGGPMANFVTLNPSTADETTNDATIERCQRRAIQLGYGALLVTNLFAYRSTKPGVLYPLGDPIGPANDEAIITAAQRADLVVCGWGNHGQLHDRGDQVLKMLRAEGVVPHALEINGGGQPKHPLYIGYEVQPQPIRNEEAEHG